MLIRIEDVIGGGGCENIGFGRVLDGEPGERILVSHEAGGEGSRVESPCAAGLRSLGRGGSRSAVMVSSGRGSSSSRGYSLGGRFERLCKGRIGRWCRELEIRSRRDCDVMAEDARWSLAGKSRERLGGGDLKVDYIPR